jgi:hypothetical protein
MAPLSPKIALIFAPLLNYQLLTEARPPHPPSPPFGEMKEFETANSLLIKPTVPKT